MPTVGRLFYGVGGATYVNVAAVVADEVPNRVVRVIGQGPAACGGTSSVSSLVESTLVGRTEIPPM
jgi:hypothetical protein